MDCLLSRIFDKANLKTRTNQWFYHIQNFLKEHIILVSNINQSDIHEEERYISFMTPTGFINFQEESRF